MKLSTLHLPLAFFSLAAGGLNVVSALNPENQSPAVNWAVFVLMLAMAGNSLDTWWRGRKKK